MGLVVVLAASLAFTCHVTRVVDGDSLVCEPIGAIRVAGVDAAELHGCHGRKGRVCVAGDGYLARDKMAALAGGKMLRCNKVGVSYNRTVARCALPNGRDLGCEAIREGVAVRWQKYDRAGLLVGC